MRVHYTRLLISSAIIKRNFYALFGEKLDLLYNNGHGKIDRNDGRVRHNWLVLRIYEFMDKGMLEFTPELRSDAKEKFNGKHKLVIDNLEGAKKDLGDGFYGMKPPFFVYDGEHEIDIMGFRNGSVVGVEVKSRKKKNLNEQIAQFRSFARTEYPQLGTELYYYNGLSGLYLIKEDNHNINPGSHYYHALL